MKLKHFSFFICLIALSTLVSCVPEESCKFCQAVVYDVNTGAEIDRQDAVEYCGDDLLAKENSNPVIIGNEKTVWECK